MGGVLLALTQLSFGVGEVGFVLLQLLVSLGELPFGMLGGGLQLGTGSGYVGAGVVLLALLLLRLHGIVLCQESDFSGLQPLVQLGSFLLLFQQYGLNGVGFFLNGGLCRLLPLEFSAQVFELFYQLWPIFAVEGQAEAAVEASQLAAHERLALLGIG